MASIAWFLLYICEICEICEMYISHTNTGSRKCKSNFCGIPFSWHVALCTPPAEGRGWWGDVSPSGGSWDLGQLNADCALHTNAPSLSLNNGEQLQRPIQRYSLRTVFWPTQWCNHIPKTGVNNEFFWLTNLSKLFQKELCVCSNMNLTYRSTNTVNYTILFSVLLM